jgi:hypothetical protein
MRLLKIIFFSNKFSELTHFMQKIMPIGKNFLDSLCKEVVCGAPPHTPQGVGDSLTTFGGRARRILRRARPQGQVFSFNSAPPLRKLHRGGAEFNLFFLFQAAPRRSRGAAFGPFAVSFSGNATE